MQIKRPENLTPMMENWWEIKSKYQDLYPGSVVAFRMGDFYEFFYDDARVVANLAGITLTKRGKPPNSYALAGVPHQAAKIHFRSLLKKNQTIVVVEQLEDPKKATGPIVKRGVIGVLSPGTVFDDELLEARKNNFIMSLVRGTSSKKHANAYGAAFIDLSCGEFWTWEGRGGPEVISTLLSLVSKYSPVECIVPPELFEDGELCQALANNGNPILKKYDEFAFSVSSAREKLLDLYRVLDLKGLDLDGRDLATSAAGALVQFLEETQDNPLEESPPLAHLKPVRVIGATDTMVLDAVSQRNLEILRNLQDGGSRGTLLQVFDHAITPMGSRLMRKWLVEPLLDLDTINARLDVVAHFRDDLIAREDFREVVRGVGDLERLISLANHANRCNARHLVGIKTSLERVPRLKEILRESGEPGLDRIADSIPDFSEVVDLVGRAIVPNPPVTVREGDIVARGYDERLDEYREVRKNGKQWILEYESKQQELSPKKSGIKVGFNQVLGYYIQVTKATLKGMEVPPEYEQKSTLVNALRFTTPELKEMEVKILSAEENIKALEYDIFSKVRERVASFTSQIQDCAEVIAELDVLVTFAEVASMNAYCRPTVDGGPTIEIVDGRHPVVEFVEKTTPFTPNDTLMDDGENQVLLITGPNMAGKSTYLRQVALIVLLAQVGSFVPATRATVGVVDRIFTRIGASDNLTGRQSTFMVEMAETALITNNATRRSLVVIDELGRGTSTADGFSIAHAVLEYLHDAGVKTLFSTHYHQLTELQFPRLKNYHLSIKEDGGNLVFLRKLVPGGTDQSYGIHVAALAGLPASVVDRAFEVMEKVEGNDPFRQVCNEVNGTKGGSDGAGSGTQAVEVGGDSTGSGPLGGRGGDDRAVRTGIRRKRTTLASFGIPTPTPKRAEARPAGTGGGVGTGLKGGSGGKKRVHPVLKALAETDVVSLTPLEALNKISEWKRALEQIQRRRARRRD
ncbi:MAG: DNA mismatch repair protein MutS [Promethearchaeota archaeon]